MISATMETPRILGFEIVFWEQYIDINLYLSIITILNDNQIKSADDISNVTFNTILVFSDVYVAPRVIRN